MMEEQVTIKTKNSVDPTTSKITRKIWIEKSIWLSVLILLLLSAFRIPYIGQFFDSTIFGFLFGYAKYLLYGYLIFVISLKLFNIKLKAVYQKRFILLMLVLTAMTSVCLGGIELLAHSTPNLLMHYINDIWYEQIWNFSIYFVYGVANFVDGGLIGTLFASISGAFIILFALASMLLAYFSVFKTHWEYIKVKVLRIFNKKHTAKLDDNNQKNEKPHTEPILNHQKTLQLNLDEQITTSINIDQEATLLGNFLSDNNISFSVIEKHKDDINYWLTIKASSEQIAKVCSLRDSFKLIGLNHEYHLMSTDEIVRIEYPRTKPVLNQVLKKFLCTNISVPLDFPLAVSENHKPVILNLGRDNRFGIFDPKNNSVNNFVNCLVASISVHYTSDHFAITYMNPFSERKNLLVTDLSTPQQILGLSGIRNYFNQLEKTIEALKTQFTNAQVTDIHTLNNKSKQTIKSQIVIIDYIDFLKINDNEIYNKLQKLPIGAELFGISFFCIDHSIDGITSDEIKYEIVLGFSMDSKLSKKLFDSSSASVLEKHNHAILAKPHQQLKMKVIIPNISNHEFQTLESKFAKISAKN